MSDEQERRNGKWLLKFTAEFERMRGGGGKGDRSSRTNSSRTQRASRCRWCVRA